MLHGEVLKSARRCCRSQVGLPRGLDGVAALAADYNILNNTVGFSTLFDNFSIKRPTALSLLHAALNGYSFVPGAGAHEEHSSARRALTQGLACFGFSHRETASNACCPGDARPGAALTSRSFPMGPVPTLLATLPPALLRGVVVQSAAAATVIGLYNNVTIISVRWWQPWESCCTACSSVAHPLRKCAADCFLARSSRPQANHAFCGGFVVHVVDDILWPSPTPRAEVARFQSSARLHQARSLESCALLRTCSRPAGPAFSSSVLSDNRPSSFFLPILSRWPSSCSSATRQTRWPRRQRELWMETSPSQRAWCDAHLRIPPASQHVSIR